jgi:hypothetical protein
MVEHCDYDLPMGRFLIGTSAAEIAARSPYGINTAGSSETSVYIYHNPKREYFWKYVIERSRQLLILFNGDDTWLWSTGGMILTRENRRTLEKKKSCPPQCHFVHHKSQVDLPGMEHGPLRWKPCWQHFWYRHDNLTEKHDVTICLNSKQFKLSPLLLRKRMGERRNTSTHS